MTMNIFIYNALSLLMFKITSTTFFHPCCLGGPDDRMGRRHRDRPPYSPYHNKAPQLLPSGSQKNLNPITNQITLSTIYHQSYFLDLYLQYTNKYYASLWVIKKLLEAKDNKLAAFLKVSPFFSRNYLKAYILSYLGGKS